MGLRPWTRAAIGSPRWSRWTVAACVVAALLGAGCGSTTRHATAGVVVDVTERDFHIATSTAHVAAGVVDLRVHNNGPDQHELIVVPVRPDGLPIRPDGFTVNEEAIQNSEPGALDPGHSGATRDLTVNLKPGRYLLFCNMAGHYMGGMHTVVVVG
jgi:uncharacterized cupredoxin-like copper-binding protein